MWVEFVVGSLLCSKRFFSGYSGFPLSSKTNISQIPIRSLNAWTFLNKFCELLGAPWVNKLHLHIYNYIYIFFYIYKASAEKLRVLGKLVLRGNHIILPDPLEAHECMCGPSGNGMQKCQTQGKGIRWPNMDKQIELFIKACHLCQLVSPCRK